MGHHVLEPPIDVAVGGGRLADDLYNGEDRRSREGQRAGSVVLGEAGIAGECPDSLRVRTQRGRREADT
eukprot:13695866-Alexandrium_andersonii.AAC.1